MVGRFIGGGLVVALFISSPLLEAQLPRPLGPRPESGLRVAPFFDGWYANPDGTFSLSFGYSNLNKETVEIPLGPNNFIVPKEYDGRQPTSFVNAGPAPSRDAGGRGAGAGGGAAAAGNVPAAGGGPAAPGGGGAGGGRGGGNNYERERGVFTITVPGTFKGDVVWTLNYRDRRGPFQGGQSSRRTNSVGRWR